MDDLVGVKPKLGNHLEQPPLRRIAKPVEVRGTESIVVTSPLRCTEGQRHQVLRLARHGRLQSWNRVLLLHAREWTLVRDGISPAPATLRRSDHEERTFGIAAVVRAKQA